MWIVVVTYSCSIACYRRQVELVADSLESMEKLMAALDKSKSKSKKDDCKLKAVLEEVREGSMEPTKVKEN